jgi:hypothetical protein
MIKSMDDLNRVRLNAKMGNVTKEEVLDLVETVELLRKVALEAEGTLNPRVYGPDSDRSFWRIFKQVPKTLLEEKGKKGEQNGKKG